EGGGKERVLAPKRVQGDVQRAPGQHAEIGVEELVLVDAVELALAELEAAGDLVGGEPVGEKAAEDGAGADAADDVDVADRDVGEEVGKGPERAELVEKALDAASGQ